MVVPVKKIMCEDHPESLYIAGSGELTKRTAEYIVKLHNNNIAKKPRWDKNKCGLKRKL